MIYVCNKKVGNVWYGVAVQGDRVVATTFSFEEPDLGRLLRRLPSDAVFEVVEEPSQFLGNVLSALDEIFNGKDKEAYECKVDLSCLSGHAQKVLNCTRLVPVGYVTSYGAIAKAAGGCARSVGNVEASNPVPLLVPCHRVVCSDLGIGGYGYGEEVKRQILRRECRGCEESKKLQVGDGELVLFPVEWVKR